MFAYTDTHIVHLLVQIRILSVLGIMYTFILFYKVLELRQIIGAVVMSMIEENGPEKTEVATVCYTYD